MINSDRARFEEALSKEKISSGRKFKGLQERKKSINDKIKKVDLHGSDRERAEEIIITTLKSNLYSKISKIVIVCGKGIHSKGHPVLRAHAENVLSGMKNYYERYTVDLNNNITVYMRKR
ncbi:MAG: Smr/MutS family protein [bacterium]|nr:Smr/MutS family protein [bacterium]